MKTKQQKKATRVCITVFNAETDVFYCDFEPLDGLRVCANTNESSVNLAHFLK
jgi:hypothetical protein